MSKLSYNNNALEINGKKVVFDDNIYQVKEKFDKIYILLDISPKKELSYDDYHNIYCYSIKGNRLWQIGIRPKGDDAIYTMINLDDYCLYANDFLGRRYKVNVETGRIEGMGIAK